MFITTVLNSLIWFVLVCQYDGVNMYITVFNSLIWFVLICQYDGVNMYITVQQFDLVCPGMSI